MSADLIADFAAITGVDHGADAGGGARSLPADQLFDPADGTVTRYVDAATAARGVEDRDVVALVAWKLLVVMLTDPPVVAYVRHRRVPDLRPGNAVVLVEEPQDGPGAIGFRIAMASPRFWVLGDDPAADDPAARVVTADELRARLRRTLIDDLTTPLVARYRAEGRLGERVLRSLAASIWYQVPGYRAPSLTTAAQRLAAADDLLDCLGEHLSPLVEEAVLEVRAGSELGVSGVVPTAIRTACCLRFKLPDESFCANCSLLDDRGQAERYAALGATWRRREVALDGADRGAPRG